MKKYLLALFAGVTFIILAVATSYADNITYTYDQLNRLAKVVYADGTTIQYGYDELGNRVTLNVSKASDLQSAFTASPTSGPAPLTVAFTDQSTGTISSWSWNFGDGGSSTSQNPSYTYSSAGIFTVTLTVSNGTQSSSQSTNITVNWTGPTANLNASPTSGVAPLTVQFTDSSTGNVTNWSWNFGDGGTSAIQNPTHSYASPGTYAASLIVTGAGGSSGPVSSTITVNPQAPGADFYATPTSGVAPLTVSFTNDSTGIITAWSWSFGDGATSTSENPSHTYAAAGTYVAALTVSGPNGYSSTKSISVTVNPVIAPIAGFTAIPANGTAPLTVSFTDSSTGTVTAWSWDFGDGGTSTSQNPTHTYASAGTYTATLTVTGPTGSTSSNSITITTVSPAADFVANPTSGGTPLTVQFTDTSTGSPTTWSWDFGDGGTSTSQNPNHTYYYPGTFTVSLTINGPGGSNTKTQTGYITVTPSPPGIDQYTKLLLHLDGANGSKTFVDSESIPKTIQGYGEAQISTAQSVFGGASLLLNGEGSYLTVPPSPDWNFSGDFTIDFWWCNTSSSNTGSWWWNNGSDNPLIHTFGGTYSFLIEDLGGSVYVWISSDGTSWDIANKVEIGTSSGTGYNHTLFDHYALVRSGNTYYTFQNGVLTNSFSSSLSPRYDPANSLNIGGPDPLNGAFVTVYIGIDGLLGYFAEGYVDEVRVSNGIARWTSNFTPPAAPYSAAPQPPTADFTSNTTIGDAPLSVQFTDDSTGSVASWSWDFGDGGTNTSQYPAHTYFSPGTYTVTLTVSGPQGSATAVKTGYITANAAPPGIDQYTKLMLHLDGANGSRTFVDSEFIPKIVTGYGEAQISTAQSVFGGASLLLNGEGSYLTVPPSPDWAFPGDFTIDFWWYRTGDWVSIPFSIGDSLLILDYEGAVAVIITNNNGAVVVNLGSSSGTGFDHFALVRSGNTYYSFQNGSLTNIVSSPVSPYYDPTSSLYIGQPLMGYFAEGYVDEVRVSNGIARWPSNFTPPASEYTNKTTPTINWPTPAPITYGTALSATQLNATASANGTTVPGNFVYSPPATTLLPVGNNQTLNVTFTPTDTTDYATATGSARINVNQATTTTVENAASGTYGGTAALSATVTSGGFGVSGLSVSFFLNSSSTSVGSATTDSSGVATLTGVSLVGITAGTYPTAVGASFAGNTSYGSSSGTGSLSVGQATATVTLGSLTQTYTGSALTPANTTSPPSLAITWTGAPQTGAGSYSVTATVNDANYQGSASGTFTIAKATPAITWTNPADIAYGTALGSAQLNASAGSVAGTFAYTPASGTVLGVGSNQTLNVIFTPTDTTDFNSAAASVKINVTDSTVTVSGGAYNYPESSSYQASISFPVSVTGNPLGGSIQYIYAKDRYGFVSTGVTAVGGNSGSGVTISATGKLNGTTGYSMLLKVTTTAFEIYIYNPDGSLKFHGPNAPIAGGSITITP